jgi:hypothetical protein
LVTQLPGLRPVIPPENNRYESMPRVHKIKSKSDIVSALPKLNDEKNSDLESLIFDFHYQLEKKIVWAKHYKAFLGNEDVSLRQSENSLAEIFFDILKAKL